MFRGRAGFNAAGARKRPVNACTFAVSLQLEEEKSFQLVFEKRPFVLQIFTTANPVEVTHCSYHRAAGSRGGANTNGRSVRAWEEGKKGRSRVFPSGWLLDV